MILEGMYNLFVRIFSSLIGVSLFGRILQIEFNAVLHFKHSILVSNDETSYEIASVMVLQFGHRYLTFIKNPFIVGYEIILFCVIDGTNADGLYSGRSAKQQ